MSMHKAMGDTIVSKHKESKFFCPSGIIGNCFLLTEIHQYSGRARSAGSVLALIANFLTLIDLGRIVFCHHDNSNNCLRL